MLINANVHFQSFDSHERKTVLGNWMPLIQSLHKILWIQYQYPRLHIWNHDNYMQLTDKNLSIVIQFLGQNYFLWLLPNI